MTRINVGMQPKQLTDKHLLAEHREIKRIPNAIKSGRVNMSGIPSDFTLGAGHVKFFYNKVGYLKERYVQLYEECVRRKFKVTSFLDSFDGISDELMGNYFPTEKDRQLIVNRINEKLNVRILQQV